MYIYKNIHTLHAMHLYMQSLFTYTDTHNLHQDYLCQPFFNLSFNSTQNHAEHEKIVL